MVDFGCSCQRKGLGDLIAILKPFHEAESYADHLTHVAAIELSNSESCASRRIWVRHKPIVGGVEM